MKVAERIARILNGKGLVLHVDQAAVAEVIDSYFELPTLPDSQVMPALSAFLADVDAPPNIATVQQARELLTQAKSELLTLRDALLWEVALKRGFMAYQDKWAATERTNEEAKAALESIHDLACGIMEKLRGE